MPGEAFAVRLGGVLQRVGGLDGQRQLAGREQPRDLGAGCVADLGAGVASTTDEEDAGVPAPVPGDDHVNDRGVDVYIEPKATLFLLGTVMDFEEDVLKSGFTFKNPNQTGECGCGESVMLKPADLKALAEARGAA